jgi:heptosyltransferase-1
MKILLIKTSSLGDVVHTLPALTDAMRAIPNITFDWVVEEDFVEVAKLHPAINKVIPIALRRWRKNIIKTLSSDEWNQFRTLLKSEKYDAVIDAQGLLKSAWLTKLVNAPSVGLDKASIREPLASYFYNNKINVPKGIHAIERVRALFAQTLNYTVPNTLGDYGIAQQVNTHTKTNRVIFLHGTTWETKLWPVEYWKELALLLQQQNYSVALPWHDEAERERMESLSESGVIGLGQLTLTQLIQHISQAKAVVSVDSGLGHLATALNIPTVFLYGPTNPQLTGGYGTTQSSLSSTLHCAPCVQEKCSFQGDRTVFKVQPPCFAEIRPDRVIAALNTLIEKTKGANACD